MADKDVATDTWQRAVLAGIPLALVLTTAVTPAALAGPPAGKGKPEAKTQGPAHGAPGADNGRKLGASKGRKVRRGGSTPAPTKSPGRGNANSHAKAGKTTICHSTGSSTNPYVEITISDNALKAHARHHDGRDIIPAPAGGCEGTAGQGVEEQSGSEDVEGGVLGKRRTNRTSSVEGVDERRKRREAVGGVLGVSESNLEPQTAAAEPLAEEDDEGGSLPFTGLALGALLLMATVSVAVGTALRRASRAELD